MWNREWWDSQEPYAVTIPQIAAYLRGEGEDVATAGRTIAINGHPSSPEDLVTYANDLRFCDGRRPYRLLSNFRRTS